MMSDVEALQMFPVLVDACDRCFDLINFAVLWASTRGVNRFAILVRLRSGYCFF